MSSRKVVADFLKRESWHLVQYIDVGTTAHIFVVETDDGRCALKTRRDGDPDTRILLTEYRVLHYLNSTPMQQYVPGVGEWLPELDGFLMEYLRYPTGTETQTAGWVPELARALQTLHNVNLPSIQGLADDRPNVGAAISRRFRDLFQIVLRTDDFWDRLPRVHRSRLERVRASYPTYVGALSQIAHSLAHARAALTHGDLAGDNIMLTQDRRLTIADWGAARISAALTDVASLSMYANWSGDARRQFYGMYLNGASGDHEEALQCLEVLSRLYRYRSCVQSLLWLNEQGEEGLDAIGMAHFERQLSAL